MSKLVESVKILGVDGIDLTQSEGTGTTNMNANDLSSVQVITVTSFSEFFMELLHSFFFLFTLAFSRGLGPLW